MSRTIPVPGLAEVVAARHRLAEEVRTTPLEADPKLSRQAGGEVLLKLENLQRTGSFKFRGAMNAVATLTADEERRGVVTASAGNHGLGLALAAQLRGVPATVFVPSDAPATKRDRIARHGAELRLVEGNYDAAHAAALEHAARTGSRYVHAFTDPAVVAGQGTVALEILERVALPGTVVVPVGGGGLIGGIGVVLRSAAPDARIVGVQTPTTSAMHDSLAAGRLVAAPVGSTLCDGLAGDVDEGSLRLAAQVVDEVVLVDEGAVAEAMSYIYRTHGMIVEGSGAVAVAALMTGGVPPTRGPVVAVLTGANVDLQVLNGILSSRRGSPPEK